MSLFSGSLQFDTKECHWQKHQGRDDFQTQNLHHISNSPHYSDHRTCLQFPFPSYLAHLHHQLFQFLIPLLHLHSTSTYPRSLCSKIHRNTDSWTRGERRGNETKDTEPMILVREDDYWWIVPDAIARYLTRPSCELVSL